MHASTHGVSPSMPVLLRRKKEKTLEAWPGRIMLHLPRWWLGRERTGKYCRAEQLLCAAPILCWKATPPANAVPEPVRSPKFPKGRCEARLYDSLHLFQQTFQKQLSKSTAFFPPESKLWEGLFQPCVWTSSKHHFACLLGCAFCAYMRQPPKVHEKTNRCFKSSKSGCFKKTSNLVVSSLIPTLRCWLDVIHCAVMKLLWPAHPLRFFYDLLWAFTAMCKPWIKVVEAEGAGDDAERKRRSVCCGMTCQL